jgi:hypothetical protein
MTVGTEEASRLAQLALRVRWLDRYRRALAIVAAFVLVPVLGARVFAWLGDGWPGTHVLLFTSLFTVVAWWTIEVALAWLTAVWETEHDRMLRDRGLPRAELRVRRRSWLRK